MEFKTGSYNTRLILNPTDIILRFEHSETHRVYERTFFERDFFPFHHTISIFRNIRGLNINCLVNTEC